MSSAGAIAVTAIVQHFASPTELERNNEIGTTMFELITVLYAIVLAFVLITAWESVNQAGHVTYDEAGELVNVYWAAESLPDEQRDELRVAARDYTESVIEHEWVDMQQLRDVDAETLLLIDRMQAPISEVDTENEATQARIDDTRDHVRAVSEYRTERIFQAQRGLTSSMWTVLVPGALLVFAVMLTLGTPTKRYKLVLVGLVSGMVVLMLFATYQLEFPFSRGGEVEPAAYQTALERFDAIDAQYTP
ncbi:DUF4239 domain-containing protein [Glycomyces buryatensis]|uniref:DUF4239 domain-containing protein n=1 Tax=Glycomyces buryatensis TaxID=2570927 RepID=A0A4V4HSZ7_9ACTN|nr:DUF4239 domain-containing protein [Glycomyces buryatensis]THV43636.1 DUF4239 domain-containing protein [Glycomyces buryatensis]